MKDCTIPYQKLAQSYRSEPHGYVAELHRTPVFLARIQEVLGSNPGMKNA
jgi:hypothetical protein